MGSETSGAGFYGISRATRLPMRSRSSTKAGSAKGSSWRRAV